MISQAGPSGAIINVAPLSAIIATKSEGQLCALISVVHANLALARKQTLASKHELKLLSVVHICEVVRLSFLRRQWLRASYGFDRVSGIGGSFG